MKRLEWLPYVLPMFVFLAPAVYELDTGTRNERAPTIEVVASIEEPGDCMDTLSEVIVVIGPDAQLKPEVESDLICHVENSVSPAG